MRAADSLMVWEGGVKRARVPLVLWIAVLLGVLVISACGDDGDNLPPSVIITIQPEPVATVLPGCVSTDLEGWYEVVSTLIITYRDESRAAVDVEPAEVAPVVNRLVELRDAMGRQPAPECAVLTHNMVMLYVRDILTAYQRYGNGVLSHDALRTQIDASTGEIDTSISDLLKTVQGTLEQELADTRATEGAPSQ